MKSLVSAALGAAVALVFAASVSFAAAPELLVFRSQGYSIAPIAQPAGELPAQSLMLFLPVADGFAPNVNVQLQPHAGTLEDYLALSLSQFKAAGLTLVGEPKVAGGAVVFEYTGTMQGRELHWYAKAFKSGDRTYLATATAGQDRWAKVGPALKASVDSFAPVKK